MLVDSVKTARMLAKRFAVLRTRDFERHNVSRSDLSELVLSGVWERTSRGLYRSTLVEPSPHQTLLEVAHKCPRGVICLLSALRFHDLTSETPSDVWLALPKDSRTPRVENVSIQTLRFSDSLFLAGIEEHHIGGISLKVYSPAKTVVDCFRFRNRLGVSVAIEALEDAWRQREVTSDELWKFSKLARLDRVMRPYMEVVLR